MPANTTDWNSVATWERLVASIVASGVKLDLKMIAAYYGTTYNTLENRFRKIKKDAEQLKPKVDGEIASSPAKSAPKTPRKPKTPKKDPLESVTNGRVSKKTPTKKTSIKQEPTEDDGSMEDADGIDATSFGVDDDMFT